MILQSLNGYYERRQRLPDPADRLPQLGLEEKEIPFILELALDGRLIAIADTREGQGKNRIVKRYQVPSAVKKTSGIAANLLWDTAEYVLGFMKPDENQKKDRAARVAEQAAAFRTRVEDLLALVPDDVGLRAVVKFLSTDPLAAAQAQANWCEIEEGKNPVMSFRVALDNELVCQRPAVVAALTAAEPCADADGQLPCLITNRSAVPARLHSAIKGVWGAQTSGANIVSFNLDAFCSYGKEQGANAPVSPSAAFAYTTALNSLLEKGSRRRAQVGDASTVFWAQSEEEQDIELGFAALFSDYVDDPDAHTTQVRAMLESVHTGRFAGPAGDRKFYLLGLAPNAARIAVRFWQAAPMRELVGAVQRWFDELALVRGPTDPAYPTLFRLLTTVAVLGKADNVPPHLGGDIMRAVLGGGPFPATWLNAAITRCRAERAVPYLRAAVIKACLLRAHATTPTEEPTVMLNTDNPNAAYRLGRLFAALEKIQEEANPMINTTIRERYYGAASSTPVSVFTTLLRLKNHHLAKLSNRGRATNFERLLGEILGAVGDFPSHLNLPDQGRFALGYYHQRQALFTKAAAADAVEVGASDATESN